MHRRDALHTRLHPRHVFFSFSQGRIDHRVAAKRQTRRNREHFSKTEKDALTIFLSLRINFLAFSREQNEKLYKNTLPIILEFLLRESNIDNIGCSNIELHNEWINIVSHLFDEYSSNILISHVAYGHIKPLLNESWREYDPSTLAAGVIFQF